MSELTTEQILTDHEAAFARRAQWIEIGRQTGSTPNAVFKAKCRARVWGNRPDQLIGTVTQGEMTIKAFLPDLINNRFPLPVLPSDKVYVLGAQKRINSVDNNKGRHGSTQIYVWITSVG